MQSLVMAGALVGVLVAACYNPKIDDGAFSCGPGEACPAGFACKADRRCYKHGQPPTDMKDGGTTMMPDGGACWGPIAACTPPGANAPAAQCDPVCQKGCGCQQRCTFGTAGPVCVDVSTPPITVGEACDADRDICQPGSICLDEARPACGAHCYRFCRDHGDCGPNARCLGEALFGNISAKICSPPSESPPCNPTGQAPCARKGREFGCYILSARFPEQTVCECAGTVAEGLNCEVEHECRPGLECVKLPGEGAGKCRPVCFLSATGVLNGGCRQGMVCRPFMVGGVASTRVGYCF